MTGRMKDGEGGGGPSEEGFPSHVDARDNSASSGMITSTKTELQIPQ